VLVLSFRTSGRDQLLDVTDELARGIGRAGVEEGWCLLFSPHTTCAVTVNEGWDPAVASDMIRHLGSLIPERGDWDHAEGNSDAHLKTALVGPSVMIPVSRGELQLGRWQRVFLCEFDGPRDRNLWVTAQGDS
jgi:secondary thiamine-phosphate synthase enzyme